MMLTEEEIGHLLLVIKDYREMDKVMGMAGRELTVDDTRFTRAILSLMNLLAERDQRRAASVEGEG